MQNKLKSLWKFLREANFSGRQRLVLYLVGALVILVAVVFLLQRFGQPTLPGVGSNANAFPKKVVVNARNAEDETVLLNAAPVDQIAAPEIAAALPYATSYFTVNSTVTPGRYSVSYAPYLSRITVLPSLYSFFGEAGIARGEIFWEDGSRDVTVFDVSYQYD